MKFRRPLHLTRSMVVLSILCAPALGANTPINVDVDRGADKAYVVDAPFDVNVPALAKSAIRGSVRQLLDEVRAEMLTRGAR
jgi:hypothetical protein